MGSKKSGDYFFVDRRDGLPDYCKEGCVYMKEADGDDNEYCFKPSSTYTAECQDDGVTGEQGVELPEDFSTTNNMGDHGDMGDHSKPTQGGLCDFTAIDNVEEGRGYTVAGIETSEEGILKIEFEDKDAAVGIALEGEPSFDFDCVNGICTSQKPVPVGTYTVQVTNPFAEEPFNDLWEAIPYIRPYYVDGVNYCGGENWQSTTEGMMDHGDMGDHGTTMGIWETTTQLQPHPDPQPQTNPQP